MRSDSNSLRSTPRRLSIDLGKSASAAPSFTNWRAAGDNGSRLNYPPGNLEALEPASMRWLDDAAFCSANLIAFDLPQLRAAQETGDRHLAPSTRWPS